MSSLSWFKPYEFYMSSTTLTSLDESVYAIKEDEKKFFKQITRIDNDEELRRHICDIQAQAYSVFPYPCIRAFSFLRFQLCRYSVYKEILKIGRERPGAVYLEIGCAFGTDLRKLIADGYPLDNVIASDLQSDYHDLGHKLFRTTPETCPFAFIPGDVFELASELAESPAVLAQRTEITGTDSETSPVPLHSLTSLTPLHNRVSVLYASSVFHLFPPEKQQKLAHIFANILSPISGSLIVGRQIGTESGIHEWDFGDAGHAWAYSVSAWKDLWIGANGPFKAEDVDAQVSELVPATEIRNAAIGTKYSGTITLLEWNIKRV